MAKPTGSIQDYCGSGPATEAGMLEDYLTKSQEELRALVVHMAPPEIIARASKEDLAKAAVGDELRKRDNARWRPGDYEFGVGYYGPWQVPFDGFNEHVRRCALALAGTGCAVHLQAVYPMLPTYDEDFEALLAQVGHLATASVERYSVRVYQVVPQTGLLQAILHNRHFTPAQLTALAKTTVLSTVWERSPAPPGDVDAMNRAGQVWVACKANADMLAESGVRPEQIRVIPIPFFNDDPLLGLIGRKRAPGPPRFYHIGKWEPRKAPNEMIGAFMQAFAPGEAELHIKTSSGAPEFDDYPPSAAHAVFRWLEHPAVQARGWTVQNFQPWVKAYPRRVPRSQIVALHAMCDVYVTLARAEGFEMSAFDAKLAGNRMVYTPSGGPQDFADEHDVVVAASDKVPVHPWYGWPGSSYLDFRMEDAIQALRTAAMSVGGGGRPIRQSPFSASAVGERMQQALQQLTGGRPLSKRKATPG